MYLQGLVCNNWEATEKIFELRFKNNVRIVFSDPKNIKKIGSKRFDNIYFFQNGRHGGHLGFAIAKKFAVFQPSTQVEFTSEGLN